MSDGSPRMLRGRLTLQLIARKNTDDLVAACDELASCEAFSCANCDLTDRGLRLLEAAKKLEKVSIQGTLVTGRGLDVLHSLPKLVELHCSPQKDTAIALEHIGRLRRLTHLGINFMPCADEDLPALANLVNLVRLDLSGVPIKEALTSLHTLTRLESLSMPRTQITSAEMAVVGHMADLDHLDVSQTAIDDDAMPHIVSLPKLKLLGLSPSNVTVKCIEFLPQLKRLELLFLEKLRIDRRAAEHLVQLKRLRHLFVTKGFIAEDAIAYIREKLPNCEFSLLERYLEPETGP